MCVIANISNEEVIESGVIMTINIDEVNKGSVKRVTVNGNFVRNRDIIL
jgi:hypothetical protein